MRIFTCWLFSLAKCNLSEFDTLLTPSNRLSDRREKEAEPIDKFDGVKNEMEKNWKNLRVRRRKGSREEGKKI
jgi:hypothetical protein